MKFRSGFLCVMALWLVGCPGLTKLNYSALPDRAAWQHPDQVISALELKPGDHVADIGAGEGYFTFPLADAVGPGGIVYAVEVEEEITQALEAEVEKRGYENIEVVLGEFADPKLPDGSLDVAFICNTYHHIEGQREYFAGVRRDLKKDGKLAVVEGRAKHPVLIVKLDWGHWTDADELHADLAAVGYTAHQSFDFLPFQIFEVFTVGPE